MKIAICEDEINMQQRLNSAIKDWAVSKNANVNILCYPSAEAFLYAWDDISFDVAFLDIQMKDISGIELAEHIRKTDTELLLVFVTSFSQYVLKGYDVNALHYLIKPLSPAKLFPILDKAHIIWRSRQNSALPISDDSGRTKLLYDNIYCISMTSHTAKIYTENDIFELRKTADELSGILPNYFVRCHRSHIVNLLKADCVYKDNVLLSNGVSVPVSRGNSKIISDAFMRLHSLE